MDEQQILLYLLDNKTINRQEATNLIGLKNTKTYHVLLEMINKNLIERKGKARATYYQLNPKTN